MLNLLSYSFFSNALLGAFLASIVCGIMGTYIVSRRLVFISGGITHASFGGIGLGVFLGISPVVGAMVFAVLSALGVQWLSAKRRVRQDSAIAMFWTFGMSVGIIFSFLTPGFMPDLPGFLFGSILTIGSADLWLLLALTVVVALVFALWGGTIVSIAFDADFARSRHLPVAAMEYMLMALTAVTIVSTLRLVGVVLAISLLSIPQTTANLFCHRFGTMAALSVVLGWVYCGVGLLASYWLNVPSGACIILVSVVVYAILRTIKQGVGELILKRNLVKA